MRRLIVVSCLLTLCPWGNQGHAQPQWTVTAGLEGACRRDGWVPLILDLSGAGAATRGRITVPIADASSRYAGCYGPSRLSPAQYVVDFELPAQSRKRLHMCVPASGLETVYVNIGPEARVQKLDILRTLGGNDWLMVVAGGEVGVLRFLQGETLGLGAASSSGPVAGPPGGGPRGRTPSSRIEYAQVPWTDLPQNPLGWDAAETIILGDGNLSQAAPAALEALLRWVRLGGTLFVPGGAAAQTLAASPFASALPIQVEGTEAVLDVNVLSAFAGVPAPPGPVLLAKGSLASGARVIAGTSDRPLILARPVGSGHIIMPLFDYGANPFKYWTGQSKLWVRLLREVRPAVEWTPATNSPSYPGSGPADLAQLSQMMPESRLPSLTTLIFFLGLYMVVLAPGQYLLLKALDKREFAWVITPVIIVAFSFSAYGVSLGTRGNRTVLQSVCVVTAAPGSSVGRAEGATSLFSAGLARYDLECGKEISGVRVLEQQGGSASGQPTIRLGTPISVEKLPMNMWSTRSLSTEGAVDLQGGIQVKRAEWDGKLLTVKVVNGTSLRFENSGIVSSTQFVEKGALQPGAGWTAAVNQQGGRVLISRTHVYGMGSGPPAGPPARTSPPSFATQGLDEELLAWSAYGVHPGIAPYFVGVINGSLLPVHLRRGSARTKECSIVVVSLPVRLPPAMVMEVPAWLTSSRQAVDGLCCTVPVGPNGGKAIRLICANAGPSGAVHGSSGTGIEVFNNVSRRWMPIRPPYGRFPIPQPEQCMTRDGEIRLRSVSGSPLTNANIGGTIQSF